MGMTESYLDILNDSLTKKEKILDMILDKSNAQMSLLEGPGFDLDEFDSYSEEKAELIDKLNSLDEGFQSIYDKVKEELDQGKERYVNQIASMQKKISSILEKSNHLMAMEKRAKEKATKQFAIMHKEIKAVKKNQQYASSYYKSMNKLTEEPVFMDQKK